MTIAKRFFARFRGLDRAYGSYTVNSAAPTKEKVDGRAKTIQSEVNETLWGWHLDGRAGIGIVPITDDGVIYFGSIDIDVYDLDLKALEKQIQKLKLPLIVLRTKSGGAHCSLFGSEALDAKMARKKLSEMAVALGFPGVEVFPKQTRLASKMDVGNWINMPYFEAENTTRYAIKDGKPLTATEFLDYADEMAVTGQQLLDVKVKFDNPLPDGPPCLQVILKNGIGEGMRNEMLFNLGVYARMRFNETWETALNRYNQEFVNPPVDFREISIIAKQVDKKDYFYRCNQPPLVSHCNKEICMGCKFGIGEGSDDPGVLLDTLTKLCTQPAIWFLSVNGMRIQMTTEELMSQAAFAKKCVENLMFYPDIIKPKKWKVLINKLLAEAEILEAPDDASAQGQLMYHVEQFCVSRAPARTKEELLLGKPWTDDNKTYFRSADLISYLEQKKFRAYKQHEVWANLKANSNVKHHQFNIKSRCVQCWSVPEYQKQDSAFSTPTLTTEEF